MAAPLVLCYHAVSERWSADLSVTPDALEHHMRRLLHRGLRPRPLLELLAGDCRKAFAVTFDDAFRSVRTRALPVLRALGVPATVFVPTAQAGTGEPMVWSGVDKWVGTEHEQELVGCTWDEISELAAEGWDIGSHTRTHPHLTRLSDDALRDELAGSREDLERRFRRPCPTLAYPYGDHDERVVRFAAEAGYEIAVTLPNRLVYPGPLAVPRVFIGHADQARRSAVKLAPATLALRRRPVWDAIHRVRLSARLP